MSRPRSPVDTPGQRSARARRAALQKASFAPDNMAAARDAKLLLFEKAVDVDLILDGEERRRRGHRLFRAWMTDLAYQASRERRGQSFRTLDLSSWLEAAMKKAAPSQNGAAQEDGRDHGAPTPTES